MDTIIIILLSTSILLFIISFFQKDRTKQLEKELEELSFSVLQENYQLKKRMKVLEEELLMEDTLLDAKPLRSSGEPNEILKNHVLALYNQGLNIQQIANQSSLSPDIVGKIISRLDPHGGFENE